MSLLDPRAVRDWCRKTFLNKDDVLRTKETVEANAEEGKTVDALVVKEVFISVSDGKKLIASAITDKGVQTDAGTTFEEMAGNISRISGGGTSGDIESPVLFRVNYDFYVPPYGALQLSNYFPLPNAKKAVLKTLSMRANKSSTSASNKTFFLRIMGKNSAGSEGLIKDYSVLANSTSNASAAANDVELDLSGYAELTRVFFYASSSTANSYYYRFIVNAEFELYP